MMAQELRTAVRAWRQTPALAITALLTMFEQSPEISDPNQTFRVSPPNYLTWAERARSLVAVAAFQSAGFVVGGARDVERVSGAQVTASLFRVLDVALGGGTSRQSRAAGRRPAAAGRVD
jgi:hypothetical protein